MTTTYIVLLALALLIIASLGAYALHLLRRVKQTEALQKEEEALAEMNLRKRQQDLLQDIRFISRSVVEEQCEITEGVMRLHYLVTALDPVTWQASELTAVRSHHDATSDMPILEAYKALTPKQQFAIDKKRLTLEEDNQVSIRQELKWLSRHQFPNVTLLQ